MPAHLLHKNYDAKIRHFMMNTQDRKSEENYFTARSWVRLWSGWSKIPVINRLCFGSICLVLMNHGMRLRDFFYFPNYFNSSMAYFRLYGKREKHSFTHVPYSWTYRSTIWFRDAIHQYYTSFADGVFTSISGADLTCCCNPNIYPDKSKVTYEGICCRKNDEYWFDSYHII